MFDELYLCGECVCYYVFVTLCLNLFDLYLCGGCVCDSVFVTLVFVCPMVRAVAHGAMGRQIDPSWGEPTELFLVPASAPRLM